MKHTLIIASIDTDDDLARAVLLAADDLARRDNARTHVVGAWPALIGTPASPLGPVGALGPVGGEVSQEAVDAYKQSRADHLAKLRAMAAGLPSVAHVAMLDGEPGDAVARYAGDNNADIIVTGSHQRGFWGALFASSSSRDLVREAPCGVFLVTRPYAEKLLAAV